MTQFNYASTLLRWYKKHGRKDLPWRQHFGRAETPYHTWLSEIMLQQTGVATVIPYYQKFITRWPTVEKLARAKEDDILHAWAGLGYYSRARNLQKCAQQIVTDHDCVFPNDVDSLCALPGIGPYTANAIRAIAFDKAANVVDGNVERVMARVFAYKKPSNTPNGKKDLTVLAARLVPNKKCGDYAQALMDLGATICTPRQPKCDQCPWQNACKAFATDQQHALPKRVAKKTIPIRYALALVVTDKKGRILMQQRPKSGLLGGLWGTIDSDWREQEWTSSHVKKWLGHATTQVGTVTHVFSHFKLITQIYHTTQATAKATSGKWFDIAQLPAISTLHRKILQTALGVS
jgi:A/G-specific adenine glycosylase